MQVGEFDAKLKVSEHAAAAFKVYKKNLAIYTFSRFIESNLLLY